MSLWFLFDAALRKVNAILSLYPSAFAQSARAQAGLTTGMGACAALPFPRLAFLVAVVGSAFKSTGENGCIFATRSALLFSIAATADALSRAL